MYSVRAGFLLKFDWNYASQTKDSMGLTITLNREINKTFTLFTSLIRLWRICVMLSFPKLCYPALHCVLMLKISWNLFCSLKWAKIQIKRSFSSLCYLAMAWLKNRQRHCWIHCISFSFNKPYTFKLTKPKRLYLFK